MDFIIKLIKKIFLINLMSDILSLKCPKCSSSETNYLYCKECSTYYCIVCCCEYYQDKETGKNVSSHNPHCNNNDLSSVDLSDYED